MCGFRDDRNGCRKRCNRLLSNVEAAARLASSLSPQFWRPPHLWHLSLILTAFIPTILSNDPPTTPLYSEEAFDPLATLLTFDTDKKGLAFANEMDYGLHAAVFTRDLRRALAVAKKFEAGGVHVNSMTVHDEPALPIGGGKGSGLGRFDAGEGMEDFLMRKVVTRVFSVCRWSMSSI